MGYLEKKAEHIRASRLAPEDAGGAIAMLRGRCRSMPAPPNFEAALTMGDTVTLLAEFKRRSPSAGNLAEHADVTEMANLYRDAGARAISVLTDVEDFGGNLDDLRAVAEQVPLPVLRKDFLVDELGLCEGRYCGAAAVLLIVRILDAGEVESLLRVAKGMGLACLVEVHDERELDVALVAGASVVGINNRDLEGLTTDLAVTERLGSRAGKGVAIVSESGIRSPDDVKRMRDAGAHAVLVGEALLSASPSSRFELVQQLAGVQR